MKLNKYFVIDFDSTFTKVEAFDVLADISLEGHPDKENLKNKIWEVAERLAKLVEEFPTEKLEEDFTDKKYETYYKNIQGIIEHVHYHLGQIVLLKKLVMSKATT